MKINTIPFGSLPSGEQAWLFQLENDNGITIAVTNYGCTLVSLQVPDKRGEIADIITGYRTWEEWLNNPAYFGCVVGRTCNRIAGARFSIDGKEYKVSANMGEFQLHGGFEGFQNKLWKAEPFEKNGTLGIGFEYLSPDGEEGFPGTVKVSVIYNFSNTNEFSMEFQAETDKATPISLTNHTYFNLAGENSGDIYRQELQILADQITETNSDSIPTGRFIDIKNTAFDFTEPHAIGERIHTLPMGYDDNFVLRNQSGQLARAITANDPGSGRMLEVYTTEPGVQLYTSNWFDGIITGKGGTKYLKHHAFAMETQHFPDSMNHPEFPNVILRPGEHYRSQTVWKFSIK